MGAPKQKWTREEEAALKAGVLKHGPGKWRTILKDPQFSGVLYIRSNVDLKDKWRNMKVIANGWGSRERGRLALKRTKYGENSTTLSSQSDGEGDGKAFTNSGGSSANDAPKRSLMRLDNLIIEAINSLREPGGSSKTTIAAFIEDQYWAPPNFKRILSSKLKHLASTGKLIKMKRKYSIASSSAQSDKRRNPSAISVLEARLRISSKIDSDEIAHLTKSQIDLELAKARVKTPDEAAAAAAQAVAEAEAAMREAEEAAREAEAAEADAEAAQAFAEAAMKTLKSRDASKMDVTMLQA